MSSGENGLKGWDTLDFPPFCFTKEITFETPCFLDTKVPPKNGSTLKGKNLQILSF